MQRTVSAYIKENGCMLLILTAALAVRVYRFGAVPGGFNQDEAMAAYEAWSLATYGTDRFGMHFPVLFTAWGFAQMNVLQSYLMIPFIKIFGLSNITARLSMLFASIAGLCALYGFIRKAFNRKVAFAVLAFASIAPWHVMQSRWALESNLLPHMLMLAVYFLHKGLPHASFSHPDKTRLRRGQAWCLCVSMVCFALSMYAYGIAYYTVPLLLVVYCVYLLRKHRLCLRHAIWCAVCYLAFAWPLFAVMLINTLQMRTITLPFLTIPYFPQSVRMSELLPFAADIPRQLKENAVSLWHVVVLQSDGLPWNVVPGYGTLYRWSLPFTVAGLVYCTVKCCAIHPVNTALADRHGKNNKFTRDGGFLLLTWFAVAVCSGLIIEQVNINRENIILYPLMILTGVGLYAVTRLPAYMGRVWSCNFRIPTRLLSASITCVLAVGSIFSCVGFIRAYFGSYRESVAPYFYGDLYTCLNRVSQMEYDTLYVTAWTQYPGAAYVSEILTQYGLRIDPVYAREDTYKQRYYYATFDKPPDAPVAGETAVYIFNIREYAYFSGERFETKIYGGYGIAVAR